MKISPIIIGQGGQAQIKLTNVPNVVCKILPKKNNLSNDEVNITKRFRNTSNISNISNLIDVREDSDNVYMFLEKLQPIDFSRLLNTKQTHNKPLFIKQTLQSLYHIHEYSIIHNDIKFDNIMMNANNEATIIDFGCSLYVCKPIPPTTFTTPLFTSPEKLCSKTCFKSDIWSVGVMTYYLLKNNFPFDAFDMYKIFKKIIKENPDCSGLNKVESDFVKGMLNKQTDERFSIVQALNHPWLNL
jgi:serine/threonine protein kinase